MISRLSVIRIYEDSTTSYSTTIHDIQHLWNSGTATVHTNLHEKICPLNGRKCTCPRYRPPVFERYILELYFSPSAGGLKIKKKLHTGEPSTAFEHLSGRQVFRFSWQIRVWCCTVVVNVYVCPCSFSNHVIPCTVRTTGLHDRILLKMPVTHYDLPVVYAFILHQNGHLVPKRRTQR